MKEYKLVNLNKGLKMSREKDLEQAQNNINEYVAQGWETSADCITKRCNGCISRCVL